MIDCPGNELCERRCIRYVFGSAPRAQGSSRCPVARDSCSGLGCGGRERLLKLLVWRGSPFVLRAACCLGAGIPQNLLAFASRTIDSSTAQPSEECITAEKTVETASATRSA